MSFIIILMVMLIFCIISSAVSCAISKYALARTFNTKLGSYCKTNFECKKGECCSTKYGCIDGDRSLLKCTWY